MQLHIGSRGSQLALWQANHIAEQLRHRGPQVEIRILHTTGDKILDVALSKVGSKGMFTKEIEQALESREIEVAVHSLKDLPVDVSERFEIAAIPEREDPRDAVCGALLNRLKNGARVGTSSSRRAAQLRTESRGAHYRTDFPNAHPTWRGRIHWRRAQAPVFEEVRSTPA